MCLHGVNSVMAYAIYQSFLAENCIYIWDLSRDRKTADSYGELIQTFLIVGLL